MPLMIGELTEWSQQPDALRGFAEDSHNESAQQVVARVLGDIGPAAKEAVPLLQMMQRSTFDTQRAAATEALEKIMTENGRR